MMRRGMLPIIMLTDGDLRIVLHLVPFWILTIWGSAHHSVAIASTWLVAAHLPGNVTLRLLVANSTMRSCAQGFGIPQSQVVCMAHWCVFMLWFPDKVPCELSWQTSTFLPTMSNITKKSVPGLRTWCLRESETQSMKRLSSQRWPQASGSGTEEIWEKLKSSLLKAAKNVCGSIKKHQW